MRRAFIKSAAAAVAINAALWVVASLIGLVPALGESTFFGGVEFHWQSCCSHLSRPSRLVQEICRSLHSIQLTPPTTSSVADLGSHTRSST